MPVGSIDSVTDTTIWGRVWGDDVTGPVRLRVEVDGVLWKLARAAHVDPDGGPWRFAIHHDLAAGSQVSVYALVDDQDAVLLAGSPATIPAPTPPVGEFEGVDVLRITGWARHEEYDGPLTVAVYVDGALWAEAVADGRRPDLAELGIGPHAFAVPHALTLGQQVDVYALGVRSDGSSTGESTLLPGSPRGAPPGYVAPGVLHQVTQDPAGPFHVQLVTVYLSAPSTVDTVLARDALPGFETTSSMARRRGAAVAVNADYWDPDLSGRPVHTYAEDGRLIQTPRTLGRNFALDSRETAAFMDFPNPRVVVELRRAGATVPVQRVNRGAPLCDEVVLFTPEGGTIERPPQAAFSVHLRAAAAPVVRDDGWVETVHTVEPPAAPGGELPDGTVVLSAAEGGVHVPALAALEPGDEVGLAYAIAWGRRPGGNGPGVLDTLGGNPTLVEGGRVVSGNVDGTAPFFRRNPRTAVGATADGRLLLVTVDGRLPGHSVGMTLRELAELFIRLGAVRALNLDGGGSTTMVVHGTITNRVSDGQERPIPNALLVLAGADEPLRKGRRDVPPEPAQPDLEAMAADPASTAGLAQALRELGEPLPADFHRLADDLERHLRGGDAPGT
jgi:hypothetical protein